MSVVHTPNHHVLGTRKNGCVNRVSSANAQSTRMLANPTPPVHHTFDVRELSSALVTLVEDLFATESVEIVWQKHKQILAL